MGEIGNTKLVRLFKIEKYFDIHNKIFAKVENSNPTGSIKDRTVYGMLLEYQKKYDLSKTTFIEATSGNTGISLAYFQSEFKYKAIIVMPISASIERRKMIEKYNGILCLVNGGMKECKDKVKELLLNNINAVEFNQFFNLSNLETHFKYTAKEIDDELKNIDYIFDGFGSGGTISGIGKYYKTNNLSTKIIAIEPLESPLLTRGYANTHLIQGIGANFIPDNFKIEYIDKIVDVNGLKSIEMAKKIREIENLDIGISSGASLLGALNYIKEMNIIDKTILLIFPDKGDRYKW